MEEGCGVGVGEGEGVGGLDCGTVSCGSCWVRYCIAFG